MLDVVLTILSLLVALSLLIAVHELGHFLVARWCGVKVLRFSIGFGKSVWQRRFGPDQTEFTLAAIPLGGYVKMVDEREGEVAEEDLPRAFNRQSVARRSAIVVAGPLFNFIFAIVAYWLMFVIGVSGVKPLLGEIEPGTIAHEAGLRAGQEILAVDGAATPTWRSVVETIMPKMLLGDTVTVTVFDGGLAVDKPLEFSGVDPDSKPAELFARLGLKLHQPPIEPVIGEVLSGSVAEQGGIQPGDRVLRVNDRPIADWQELVETISASPGKELALLLRRDGKEQLLHVRPEAVESSEGPVGRIGAAVKVDPALYQPYQARMQYGAGEAVSAAVARTWEVSSLTLKMVWQMLTGRASVENLSGPIGIAQYAKQSASEGFSQFLKFLGLISVSLGVLNLLPIPVLDGGHLLYFMVEAVRGKPVSAQVEAVGQRVGLALILMMMMVAVYNDVLRIATH